MTKEQAMDTVVKVTGEFKGNRQDHAVITEALQVIHRALTAQDTDTPSVSDKELLPKQADKGDED